MLLFLSRLTSHWSIIFSIMILNISLDEIKGKMFNLQITYFKYFNFKHIFFVDPLTSNYIFTNILFILCVICFCTYVHYCQFLISLGWIFPHSTLKHSIEIMFHVLRNMIDLFPENKMCWFIFTNINI